MAEKKSTFEWLTQLFSMIGEAFNALIEHSNAEIEKIKRKIVHYIIIYGLFIMSLFFLIIGAVKYFFPNEGLGFMIVGAGLIVILAAYSLLSRI